MYILIALLTCVFVSEFHDKLYMQLDEFLPVAFSIRREV